MTAINCRLLSGDAQNLSTNLPSDKIEALVPPIIKETAFRGITAHPNTNTNSFPGRTVPKHHFSVIAA